MTQMRKITISLLGSTALLAGCTANSPNLDGLNNSSNQNRNSGAVMGAAIGGLLAGPAAGGGGGQTAAGAAAGAAIGGLIGAGLDRQAAELQRDLGDGITVDNQGDQLLVSFPQDILFATDSASIPASRRQELNTLAANLQRYPDTDIEVIGHTDNTGAAAYNVDLSARRAGTVSSVLVGAGVPGGRISTIGRGEDAPIATNLNDEGRAQNRRVEVVIRPKA